MLICSDNVLKVYYSPIHKYLDIERVLVILAVQQSILKLKLYTEYQSADFKGIYIQTR